MEWRFINLTIDRFTESFRQSTTSKITTSPVCRVQITAIPPFSQSLMSCTTPLYSSVLPVPYVVYYSPLFIRSPSPLCRVQIPAIHPFSQSLMSCTTPLYSVVLPVPYVVYKSPLFLRSPSPLCRVLLPFIHSFSQSRVSCTNPAIPPFSQFRMSCANPRYSSVLLVPYVVC